MIIEILKPDQYGEKTNIPVELTPEEKERRMREHIEALILSGKMPPPPKK